ncbi:MAG TPA: nicotinate-nucleotide adenylyltransferase, partial [Gammaproteobacteria bacterium]|nr:nicotinate-nucleotide adenylyltransferase [Gammaproteobacteria bacterium]
MHNKTIGIFGGTFDPIHFGHLRTALEIFQAFHLSEVRFIPSFQPVHRKMPVASAEDRLAMIELAIQNEPALTLDDCEIKRQGPSYMIDTLRDLQQKFSDTSFILILGIDALLKFPTWHQYEEILSIASLVVAHRPLYQLPRTGIVADLLKKHVSSHNPTKPGKIVLHPVTALEISATHIRKQIANHKNPRFLLPENVFKYIEQH